MQVSSSPKIAKFVHVRASLADLAGPEYVDRVAEARAKVGMGLVRLNAGEFTVQFAREGVMLDLGAIGKGYAAERAAEVLRECVDVRPIHAKV